MFVAIYNIACKINISYNTGVYWNLQTKLSQTEKKYLQLDKPWCISKESANILKLSLPIE